MRELMHASYSNDICRIHQNMDAEGVRVKKKKTQSERVTAARATTFDRSVMEMVNVYDALILRRKEAKLNVCRRKKQ